MHDVHQSVVTYWKRNPGVIVSMEDDSDADIYSGLGDYGSESPPDKKDSHLASAAELDLLDSSVLLKQDSPVKNARCSRSNDSRSPGRELERDSAAESCFDPVRSSSVRNDSEDKRSAVSAEFGSSDTSVLPKQANSGQKHQVPKTVAVLCPAKSLVAHAAKPSTPAASVGDQKTIVALKKENEMLRHNISILFKTAKHLVDSKEREITSLKRRLDNLVFKRNQGSKSSGPHFAASEGAWQKHSSSRAATFQSIHDSHLQDPCRRKQPLLNLPVDGASTRDAHHHYQERSESSHGAPRKPTTPSSHHFPLQQHSQHPQSVTPTKAKADMSEDLQRLYQYNSVRPENRTDFSHVPTLATAPTKKEGASRGGVVTPTKSAAQRNARRLVRNSIKNVIYSPSKQPRRLEAYNKAGYSPMKRGASERTEFAERRGSAQHKKRNAFRSEIPPENWEWEPHAKQPRTPPHVSSRVSERPRSPHQSRPAELVNKCYSSLPLRRKDVPEEPQTSPQDQTETCSGELSCTSLRARKVVKGPHTPPGEYPEEWTVRKLETPPLEDRVATGERQANAENQHTEPPAVKSDVAKSRETSKNVVPVGLGRLSEEPQRDVHLGIKRRRSPGELACRKRVPVNSSTVEKALRCTSPGRGLAVESRRDCSPRDFGNPPTKRRRSRSRSFSTSPPPRPHSPWQHSQAHRTSVHDRLGDYPRMRRIPSHHRRSPEDRSVHHRLRDHYSPVPRRRHRTERPVRSPSPPRPGRTSKRQLSPERRPKRPLVRDKVTKEHPLHEQPSKRPLKSISTVAGSVTLVQADESTGVCQEAEDMRSPHETTAPPLESDALRTDSVVDVVKETKDVADVAALCDSGDG